MSLLDQLEVQPDDGKATDQCFKRVFRVGVQNRFLNTPEMIHWVGTPSSGNKRLDKTLQDRFVTILATPIACVEYFLQGAPIQFTNVKTAAEILRLLQIHLANWAWIAENCYNAHFPPEEDFDELNEFVKAMNKYAGVNATSMKGAFQLRRQKRLYETSTGNNQNGGRKERRYLLDPKETDSRGTENKRSIENFKKDFAKFRNKAEQ